MSDQRKRERRRFIRRRRARQMVDILAAHGSEIRDQKEKRPPNTVLNQALPMQTDGPVVTQETVTASTLQNPGLQYDDTDRGYGTEYAQNPYGPYWSTAQDWNESSTIGTAFGTPQTGMAHSYDWPGGHDYRLQIGYDPGELAAMGCIAFWPMLGYTGTETTLVDIVGDYDCTATTANATGSQLVGETSTRADPNDYSIGDITGTGLASVLGNLGNTIAFWVNIDPTQPTSWATQLNWSVQRNDGGTASVQVSQQGDSVGTLYTRWIADDINDPAVNNNTDGGFWVRNDTWTVPANEWHFFTTTLGTDGIRLYWDATLQGTKTTAPKPADPNGFFRLINGQMESARGPTMIFNQALSDAEIQQLYWNTDPSSNSELRTQHKEFSGYTNRTAFRSTHELNGGRIKIILVASPNTSPDGPDNQVTQAFELTDGTDIQVHDWATSHRYFRVGVQMAPSPDNTQTPTLDEFAVLDYS